MPTPQNSWGVNTPVYAWTQSLVRKCSFICSISPNVITVLGLAVGLYVAWNLATGGPWGLLLVCAVIREFLDISDGVVARQCKSESRTGALLDVTCDFAYLLALTAGIVYRLWPMRVTWTWFVVLIPFLGAIFVLCELIAEVKRKPKPFQESFVSQNSIVMGPLLVGVLFIVGYSMN